jgi:hypothetical protein
MNPLVDAIWTEIIRGKCGNPKGLPSEIVHRYLTAVHSGKQLDSRETLGAVLAEYADAQITTALDLQARAAQARRVEAERQARERAEQEARLVEQAAKQSAARETAEQDAAEAAAAEKRDRQAARERQAAARAAWPIISPADMLLRNAAFRYIAPAERGSNPPESAEAVRTLLVARGLMLQGTARHVVCLIGDEEHAQRALARAADLALTSAAECYSADEANAARAGAFVYGGGGRHMA